MHALQTAFYRTDTNLYGVEKKLDEHITEQKLEEKLWRREIRTVIKDLVRCCSSARGEFSLTLTSIPSKRVHNYWRILSLAYSKHKKYFVHEFSCET